MKSVLRILLFTLLSGCYLNTVFEFSDEEKKSNFENETHIYIHQDSHNYNITSARSVSQHENTIATWHTENTFPFTNNVTLSFTKTEDFYQPPKRRYILYASLLI